MADFTDGNLQITSGGFSPEESKGSAGEGRQNTPAANSATAAPAADRHSRNWTSLLSVPPATDKNETQSNQTSNKINFLATLASLTLRTGAIGALLVPAGFLAGGALEYLSLQGSGSESIADLSAAVGQMIGEAKLSFGSEFRAFYSNLGLFAPSGEIVTVATQSPKAMQLVSTPAIPEVIASRQDFINSVASGVITRGSMLGMGLASAFTVLFGALWQSSRSQSNIIRD